MSIGFICGITGNEWRNSVETSNTDGLQPRECGTVKTGGKKRANPGRREREARRKKIKLLEENSQFNLSHWRNKCCCNMRMRTVGTQTVHTGPIDVIKTNWVQENHAQLPIVLCDMTI